jgi:hypothetical protein
MGSLVALRPIQALQCGLDPGLPGCLLANAHAICGACVSRFECQGGLIQAFQLCLLALSITPSEPPCDRLP